MDAAILDSDTRTNRKESLVLNALDSCMLKMESVILVS
jgi:hypothetical protein